MSKVAIVWFRQDLRAGDNPALHHAVSQGYNIVPLYIFDASLGSASRWWLHHSLKHLGKTLGGLVLRKGNAQTVLDNLIAETGADAVFWNRCYEPAAVARDTAIKENLTQRQLTVQTFNGSLLNEPWDIKTGSGDYYKVFTPYWASCVSRGDPRLPLPAPDKVTIHKATSDSLESWQLLPTAPNWATGFHWQADEDGAQAALETFLHKGIHGYTDLRNRPDRANTSRLSPYLHFGNISPRQVWHTALNAQRNDSLPAHDVHGFLRELGWREFSYSLLYHVPSMPTKPLRPAFENFPWKNDAGLLAAWQRGQTGYPIVDAGMRELWQTGYMHNRVRMVVASFLVKHLLQPWQDGAAWFWDTLLDADLANNSASWQWVAGCGADAAPYFRIFNPITQGEKFDPEGVYIRTYVPELAKLPTAYIHAPWQAPAAALNTAGITLGTTYPRPIVDHKTAREEALAAYQRIK